MNMHPELTESDLVRRTSNQVSVDFDGEPVLMHVIEGSYFVFEGAGAEVWKLTESPVLVSDVFSRLVQEFDVERDRCRSETIAMLSEMIQLGLVEIVPPEASS